MSRGGELNQICEMSGMTSEMQESRIKRLFKAIRSLIRSSYDILYGLVFHSFKSMNRKVRSKLPVRRMEEETLEHVRFAVKVFKWIVLPVTLFYVFTDFYFLKENALGSVLWGLLFFFYSSFLPDLPSIYRRKKGNNEPAKDLPSYKKYALLLFAPLVIWILFSGTRLTWRTTETFHNFKSLTIYSVFLSLLGFLAFVNFPIEIGTISKILCIPLYGIIGYLTHLKVDEIW